MVLPGDMGSLYCQLPELYVDILLSSDQLYSSDVLVDLNFFKSSVSYSPLIDNKIKPIIEKEKRLAKKPRSSSLHKNEHITKVNIQDKVYIHINFLLYDFSTINRSFLSNIILNLHSSLEYFIRESRAAVTKEINIATKAAKNKSRVKKLRIKIIEYKIKSVTVVTIFLITLMLDFNSSITIINNPYKEIT